MKIQVFPLPELVPDDARFDVSFCIDVLRATTVFVTARRHGAREIIPCLSVEEARAKSTAFAQEHPGEKFRLGGERKGVRIDGFDFGNSPFEYTPEAVGGTVLFFTTTNGTRAIHRATGRMVPVCFLNVREEVTRLLSEVNEAEAKGQAEFSVGIICAGTDGYYTDEDLLLAGCLLELIHREIAFEQKPRPVLDGEATSVWGRWQDFVASAAGRAYPWETAPANDNIQRDSQSDTRVQTEQNPLDLVGDMTFRRALAQRFRGSRGGSNLIPLGLGRDLDFAAGCEPDLI